MKKITRLAVALFAIIGMLSIPTKQAHAEGLIKNVAGWALQRTFVGLLTDSEGENVEQMVSKIAYGATDLALGTVAPELTENADAIANSDLPDSMKRGLVGIADDQLIAMFNSLPNIDVNEHLAQEWVPGYSSENSAYAGGYEDLQSTNIDQFWTKTRNVAYIAYVVILLGIGFMIMFRHQIGGQTLVTLGNSLPNVVISLILVTFSFAIAGIMIDIGGVLLSVISDLIYDNSSLAVAIHKPWELGIGSLGWAGAATTSVLSIVGIVGLIVSAMNPVGLIAAALALIIVGFVMVGAIKLWITLVKSYLSLLVNVVVGPLQLMTGALPGNSAAIGNWFKSLARNILVFPVAFAIVNLPNAIANGMEGNVEWNGFPDALVIGDASDGFGKLGGLILGLMKIFAIYFAASTPEYLKALIPSTQSKAMAEFAGAVKGGLGKVPLVGGLFK